MFELEGLFDRCGKVWNSAFGNLPRYWGKLLRKKSPEKRFLGSPRVKRVQRKDFWALRALKEAREKISGLSVR